jgi:4-diphosphocytidyl-2C-methyl-D-erythritol kinase
VGHQHPVTVRAPAKVNLGLSVGGLRPDGFHELATVFHAVSLYDDVTAAAADEISVTVEGAQADLVPRDGHNLAVRAAVLLARRVGVDDGVRLHIRKGIPVAGGMAGGSADAAAALLACDTLWGAGLSRDELRELAGELGSDVPFSLVGGTAIGIRSPSAGPCRTTSSPPRSAWSRGSNGPWRPGWSTAPWGAWCPGPVRPWCSWCATPSRRWTCRSR